MGNDRMERGRIWSKKIQKLGVSESYFDQVVICYQRYERCIAVLHPTFCTSPTKGRLSFYLWTKMLADKIMRPPGDQETQCPVEMLKQFTKIQNIL